MSKLFHYHWTIGVSHYAIEIYPIATILWLCQILAGAYVGTLIVIWCVADLMCVAEWTGFNVERFWRWYKQLRKKKLFCILPNFDKLR